MNNKLIIALALVCAGPLAMAQAAPRLNFVAAKTMQDVFSVKTPGQAGFIYAYMPYNDWKVNQSGKNFPMEVAPVLAGMAAGGVPMPPPQLVDESKFKAQAAEFAHVVNIRNKGGRAELDSKPGSAQQRLKEEQASTHVVQTVMSGVIDRPLAQLNLSPDKLATLVKSIDIDHSHFVIQGSLVLNTLEKDHIAGKSIDPNRAYLLSVFDFRDYGCPALKNGIRDHFSKRPEKDRLMNESLYVISDLHMNEAKDIDEAQKYFGKHPDAVLTQDVIFADHLIRGAKTVFVFFAEGNQTRIVLLSNIATRSKYFTGVKGAFIRQAILDGPNGAFGGAGGIALGAKDKVSAAADLLAGAEKDVNDKNTCELGLGQGLIKYSQSLFSEFTNYLTKK